MPAAIPRQRRESYNAAMGEEGSFHLSNLLFYPGGIVLQVFALVHAVRRRPETYWYWIILMGGGLGALVYIVVEMLPDLSMLGNAFAGMNRKSRIQHVESAILDNPSPANYEELGDLYWEQKLFAKSHQAYNHSIAARSDSEHTFYRRALCSLALNDPAGAIPDLEHVVKKKQDYEYHRAAALLAHAYGRTSQPELAEWWFKEATTYSTTPETLFHYAWFLNGQARRDEARQWAQKVLDKKKTLPRFMQRLDRPWFHRAQAMLKELSQPQEAKQ